MKVTIKTTVKNGRLSRNRNSLLSAIKQFEGKEVQITIEKAKKKRSTYQNRYYWGCVIPLIANGLKETTGEYYSHEVTHDLMRAKYLSVDLPLKDGEFIQRIKSTTELSTFSFEEFMTNCRDFATEYLNVFINLPNENITLEL